MALDKRFMRPHPILGIEHKPNASAIFHSREHPAGKFRIQTNNLGLRRDTGTPLTKPATSRRVLVLGDSQTDGYVDNRESWTSQLEAKLNERRRANQATYEVLNAAVMSYSPDQYYLWWQHHGRQLKPDLVVVAYYLGNDLVGLNNSRIQQDANGNWYVREELQKPPETFLLRVALADSRVVNLFKFMLLRPLNEMAIRLGITKNSIETPLNKATRLYPGSVWQSVYQSGFYSVFPQRYLTEVAKTEFLLRKLKQEVEVSGAKLVIVLIPSKLQVESDSDGNAAEAANVLGIPETNRLLEDRLEQDLSTICHDLALKLISATDGAKRAGSQHLPLITLRIGT